MFTGAIPPKYYGVECGEDDLVHLARNRLAVGKRPHDSSVIRSSEYVLRGNEDLM